MSCRIYLKIDSAIRTRLPRSLSDLIICITETSSKLRSTMADNSATLRRLGIAHILIGSLLICLGIADRFDDFVWTGDLYFEIRIGAWVSFPRLMRECQQLLIICFRAIGFLALLVSILAILVSHRVWFLHSVANLKLGRRFRVSYFFIIIEKTINNISLQCLKNRFRSELRKLFFREV